VAVYVPDGPQVDSPNVFFPRHEVAVELVSPQGQIRFEAILVSSISPPSLSPLPAFSFGFCDVFEDAGILRPRDCFFFFLSGLMGPRRLSNSIGIIFFLDGVSFFPFESSDGWGSAFL